ncbi:MAG: translocation/assembly module TamB domain-containing protein [Rubrivivax sp.]
MPAARSGLLRRAWQLVLITVWGLPLAGLLAVWAVLHSERGTAWLLAGVPQLTVTAPRGALLGPAFSAAKVQWRWDQGRQWLEIEGLQWTGAQWRWWLRPGTWAGVQAKTLQARRVAVHTGPTTGKPAVLPRSLALPLEANIALLRIDLLEVDQLPAWRQLTGRLALGAQQGTTHRVDNLGFLWEELQVSGQAAVAASPPFDGQARLEVKGTGPVAWEGEVSATGPLQALELQARLRAPALPSGLRPSLDASLQLKPFEAWPLGTLNLTLQALDLSQLSSRLPATRLTGRASVKSQGLAQPVQADILLDNPLAGPWGEARLPIRRARLDLRSRLDAHDKVDILHLDLDLGSLQRSAGLWRSSGQWADGTLRLQAVATEIKPHLLDARAPAMTLSGPVRLGVLGVPWTAAGGRQKGASPAWSVELRSTLSGALEAFGQRTTLTLDGVVQPQEIQVRSLQAQSGAASAELTATVSASPAGTWLVRSNGRISEFDPAPWVPGDAAAPWRKGPHRLNGQWALDVALPAGRPGEASLQWLQALQGSAQVDMAASRVAGLAASGRLRLEQAPEAPTPGRSQLSAELRLGRNDFSLSGQGDPGGDGEQDRWQLQVSAPALGELSALSALVPAWAAWWPEAGRADARITASGRWPIVGTQGRMTIEGLRGRNYGLALAEAGWQWTGREADPLELRGDVRNASLGPNRLARLSGEVRGTLRQHSARLDIAAPLLPPEALARMLAIPAGAGTQARVSLEGAWAPQTAGGGRWTGTVRRLEAGVWSGSLDAPTPAPSPTGASSQDKAWLDAGDLRGELRFDEAWRLRSLRLDGGQATLAAGLRMKWDEARYELRDPARADRPDFQWQADVLPFALAPWLQRAQTGLQWTGDLRLSARMAVRAAERFEAEVSLKRHDGDLQVIEAGQVQPLGLSTVDLSLAAKDGLWSFAPRLVGRSVGEVSGAVQLRTAAQDRWPDAGAALSGAVQAKVPNLGVWSGWVPPGWRLQGEVVSTASLGGRFGAPQLTGELVAQRVSVRNLLQGVDYSDGELKVALQGDTARIERLSLRSGEGRITGEGVGEFGARPSARVQVRAESFRVLGRLDRQLVASGQAVLALQPDALKLDGRVVIDSGLFDLASRDAPTLDDDVTVLGGRGLPAAAADAEPAILPRLIRQSSVHLDVDLGKKLRLRGRGLDTALQGELKLATPGGILAVNGSVRAQGGTYAAYGQKLTIERGIVNFSGRVDSPRLDILALRPNTDIRVGVAISGSPQSPRARLVSEPEMGESEKLSWLLLGRGSEGLGRTDTAVLQRAAVALLAGEGEAPTDSLLRALGIDDLSVGQVSGQTSGPANGDGRETVIRLGKQLSRNWYAGYERGVNATAGTFQLVYRVAQRFTLRAQSGLENSVDLIWTWRFEQSPLSATKRAPP